MGLSVGLPREKGEEKKEGEMGRGGGGFIWSFFINNIHGIVLK